ncbi:chorismate lyase [Alginatibacterium sediminis]|uniref:Probable chorismate pyruvate-lyase n=1 Tax=Alginatibacterium sediminis TaxID=2164068 RepID=A0A420E630_9ALTE|nr:chorismate lyase [Alginatibacterium sediminis]RKF13166.1 chorismate lyase [Alginatibacterium sediminis]
MLYTKPNMQISEPTWLPSASTESLPSSLKSWLLDPHSLTARLRKHCQHFAVRVLSEGFAPLYQSEAALFDQQVQQFWVREVELLCDGQVWVFARSVIPQSTLEQEAQQIPDLKTKPLGEFLFNHPKVQRQSTQVAQLRGNDYGLEPTRYAQRDSLWSRRSLFHLDSAPLLVTEVFLPHSAAYCDFLKD